MYTNETVEGEPSRDPILECIRSYLSITEQQVCIINCLLYIVLYYQLINNLLTKLLSKLKQVDCIATRSRLEDITESFIPYMDQVSLNDIFQFLSPLLDVHNIQFT